MFPEGSTTNGTTLIKFKRGAFASMRPVTPCFVKMGESLVNPCYDVLDFWHLVIFMMSSFSGYCTTLHIMPTFVPNDYMLKKFAHKVAKRDDLEPVEPWEIYAWCVRDAMAAESGMKVSDMPLSKKIEYENFMNHRLAYVQHDG